MWMGFVFNGNIQGIHNHKARLLHQYIFHHTILLINHFYPFLSVCLQTEACSITLLLFHMWMGFVFSGNIQVIHNHKARFLHQYFTIPYYWSTIFIHTRYFHVSIFISCEPSISIFHAVLGHWIMWGPHLMTFQSTAIIGLCEAHIWWYSRVQPSLDYVRHTSDDIPEYSHHWIMWGTHLMTFQSTAIIGLCEAHIWWHSRVQPSMDYVRPTSDDIPEYSHHWIMWGPHLMIFQSTAIIWLCEAHIWWHSRVQPSLDYVRPTSDDIPEYSHHWIMWGTHLMTFQSTAIIGLYEAHIWWHSRVQPHLLISHNSNCTNPVSPIKGSEYWLVVYSECCLGPNPSCPDPS